MKSKMMNANKVWYVTGASKGLGLSLVKKVLAEGYRVAATSRSVAQLQDAVGKHENFLALEVNLADNESIWESVQKTHKHFGSIDVVVNNAGYGIGGAAEELSDKEIKDSFDINVFATIHVVQYVLPFMRAQCSGSIINIASIAGFAAATGWGMYAATKFAVVGFTEVLAEDVRDFGIKVTVAEPGAFRTEFLSGESLVVSKNKMDAYQSVRDSHARYQTMNGAQAGDPDKAAEVFIALVENPNPPVRLFMGTDAYTRANAKLELIKAELEQWKELSFSTDFTA
jgi:NAD(P)-dependent dehydrogenase (short-subunit alcohol dehydrogenase family)